MALIEDRPTEVGWLERMAAVGNAAPWIATLKSMMP
jgi:hypothetical protein